MGRWSRRLSSPFLEFAGTKPGDRVLDVGCGTGILTSAVAERGSKAVGIDASEAYVAEARRHRSHPEVTLWLRSQSGFQKPREGVAEIGQFIAFDGLAVDSQAA